MVLLVVEKNIFRAAGPRRAARSSGTPREGRPRCNAPGSQGATSSFHVIIIIIAAEPNPIQKKKNSAKMELVKKKKNLARLLKMARLFFVVDILGTSRQRHVHDDVDVDDLRIRMGNHL